jgi:hypothetical protein
MSLEVSVRRIDEAAGLELTHKPVVEKSSGILFFGLWISLGELIDNRADRVRRRPRRLQHAFDEWGDANT